MQQWLLITTGSDPFSPLRLALLGCPVIPKCSCSQSSLSSRSWPCSLGHAEGRALTLQLALQLLKVFSGSGRRARLVLNRKVSALLFFLGLLAPIFLSHASCQEHCLCLQCWKYILRQTLIIQLVLVERDVLCGRAEGQGMCVGCRQTFSLWHPNQSYYNCSRTLPLQASTMGFLWLSSYQFFFLNHTLPKVC